MRTELLAGGGCRRGVDRDGVYREIEELGEHLWPLERPPLTHGHVLPELRLLGPFSWGLGVHLSWAVHGFVQQVPADR